VVDWLHLQVKVHVISHAAADLFAPGLMEVQYGVMALRCFKHVTTYKGLLEPQPAAAV
jgi:hypothetical protein